MGEGRGGTELKEALENYGIEYRFDYCLLIVLSYVFHNLHYLITEEIYNDLSETKLPEKFFADYVTSFENLNEAISNILENYNSDSAFDALKKRRLLVLLAME